MKKIILIVLFPLSGNLLLCGQTFQNYELKAEYLQGSILKHTVHLENLVKGPSTGLEVAVQFRTMNEKPWHQYFNFPSIGVGAVYLNLSNPDTLGSAFALYPYLNIPVVRTPYFVLNVKPGAGLSYVTKTFRDATAYNADGTVNLNRSNAAIGSHLNAYFSAGVNVEIPVVSGFSLTAAYNWNHLSNGSILQPNSGINMLNGFVGLKYFPNYKTYQQPEKKEWPTLPRELDVEITLAGGLRELYYKDNKMYPIGSLAFGVYRPMSDWYRMGLGLDVFYDGVYNGKTAFRRTYLTTNEFKNKIRAGVSWQNELIIGRLIAGVDLGLYLYDPIKNLEPYDKAKAGKLNKPLIYGYDIEQEDGWFYTRISAKYRLTRHFFASIGLKTHLQKAEFIEWGVGYRF